MMVSKELDDRKRTDTPTSENHGTLIFQDFKLSAQWDTTGHVLRVASADPDCFVRGDPNLITFLFS